MTPKELKDILLKLILETNDISSKEYSLSNGDVSNIKGLVVNNKFEESKIRKILILLRRS